MFIMGLMVCAFLSAVYGHHFTLPKDSVQAL